jgi:hypothetical protein
MTQPRFFTVSQAQRAPHRTCRPAPRFPLPSHHRHTRADTRCDKPHTAHAMARVTQLSARLQATHASNPRTATQSIQTHKPRTPARRPAQLQPLRTAHTSLHPHRRMQNGTQLRPPDTPPTENHTQSHTRPPRHTHCRATRLPSVDGMLPESWLNCKYNPLQDTRSAIASHHGTRCRRRPPASRPQRIAAHQSIHKSNESQSHCMLSLTHNTVCE